MCGVYSSLGNKGLAEDLPAELSAGKGVGPSKETGLRLGEEESSKRPCTLNRLGEEESRPQEALHPKPTGRGGIRQRHCGQSRSARRSAVPNPRAGLLAARSRAAWPPPVLRAPWSA